MKGVRIREYKKIPNSLNNYLYTYLTFSGGGLQYAMDHDKINHAFIARKGKRIIGWAAVYCSYYGDKNSNNSVGVYVANKYRHNGIGHRLRRKAMLWAIKNTNSAWWYDAENNWNSVKVTKKAVEYCDEYKY